MSYYYKVPPYCGIYYVPSTTAVVGNYNFQPSWLPQVSISSLSKLCGSAASTTLTQSFVNPSNSTLITQAKYSFPLYESCAVVSFRCFIGKRLIEGIVKEKHEAKVEYNHAVARGETAGLLEQVTPDVFTTSLGNIPAGATVKVEIEYIMELKHDAQVDGLRFTIPTSIAPRYGTAPNSISTSYDGKPITGALEKGGMSISVQISMPSNIRNVQSPSHTISMHLGGHTENTPDSDFNPQNALATLSQTSTELDQDFVLLVKCADLSTPRAMLETHPTIENSKALMVTLVPKFNLPQGPKPEVIFVVDRSGSMASRMLPLKSALEVFLKSMPVGVKFNICSFGSKTSFLWRKSESYSADTLQQAEAHVASMSADFGGTEILPPIKETIKRRYKDLPLEIMVLTDGEVWNSAELFSYIEKETTKGDVRVFTLGIGRDVSHALVEGLARLGRGFAQILADEKDGLEGKVVRMLRGGLSAHINDYRLEWDGRPVEAPSIIKASGTAANVRSDRKKKQKISLYDSNAALDAPISTSTDPAERFSHLPAFDVPTVLQAPYKIPPLFPFSRTTAYAILSNDATPPSSVWLRGTTPSGDELELEIDVISIPKKGKTIHQLGARKILQDLEEGTGYIHSGRYGVDQERNLGAFGEWVEREGVRVGLKYGLASRWTSFVALQRNGAAKGKEKAEDRVMVEEQKRVEHKAVDRGQDDVTIGRDRERERDRDRDNDRDRDRERVRTVEYQTLFVPQASFPSALGAEGLGKGFAARGLGGQGLGKGGAERRRSIGGQAARKQLATASVADPQVKRPHRARKTQRAGLHDASMDVVVVGDASSSTRSALSSSTSSLASKPPVQAPTLSIDDVQTLSARDHTKALINLQAFEGSFALECTLALLIGKTLDDLLTKLNQIVLTGVTLSLEQRKTLWATMLAVAMFEEKLLGERDMWELVVEKANNWMLGVAGDEDLVLLKKLAADTLV